VCWTKRDGVLRTKGGCHLGVEPVHGLPGVGDAFGKVVRSRPACWSGARRLWFQLQADRIACDAACRGQVVSEAHCTHSASVGGKQERASDWRPSTSSVSRVSISGIHHAFFRMATTAFGARSSSEVRVVGLP
jgi:hypothetical protein